ncbi:hypothetical protein [Streptomyces sp. 3214.6]|uniref:hypothetical protein n=1 Tax=Streptomyces sp. 3214.6 TaxID=1882757 RepID=UPI0009A8F10F|nr:hypothetical protein [Streptomyces sp. 3214.6]
MVRWDEVAVGQWEHGAWDLMFDADDPDSVARFYDRIRNRVVIDIHYESVYGGEGFAVSSRPPEQTGTPSC